MSADNGIYIVHFPDGWRVAEASSIDDIYYYPVGTPERKIILWSRFGESPVFQDELEAWNYARTLYKKISEDSFVGVEYGVSVLPGRHESFDLTPDELLELRSLDDDNFNYMIDQYEAGRE